MSQNTSKELLALNCTEGGRLRTALHEGGVRVRLLWWHHKAGPRGVGGESFYVAEILWIGGSAGVESGPVGGRAGVGRVHSRNLEPSMLPPTGCGTLDKAVTVCVLVSGVVEPDF